MAASQATAKPHVAFLPSPGMGHIVPLFEFAKRLVTHHGFQVSFLVITTGSSAAQNQFFRSPTIPPDLLVVDLPPLDMTNIFTDDMLVLTRVCVMVDESIKLSLHPILTDLKPLALVVDLFTTQAIDLARQFSVPVYSFYTASAALLAFSLYLPTLDREIAGEFVDLPEPIKVPGCRPQLTEDLLDQVKNRKIDEYKWFLYHMSRLTLVDGIFENSCDDLEPVTLKALTENPFYRSIKTPPVYPIGPLIKPDEFISEKDAKIMAWLDKQPTSSVLFVVFGSGGTLTSKQLTELAWGLELSEQRFILVARKPTDASASAAFFNGGNEDENDPSVYLPEAFVKRTERDGFGLIIPGWAPQATILGHESTGGFVSHCGWNSTLESLAHGVPILAWPLYAEQRMNAAMLEEEIGVAVRPMAEEKDGERIIGRREIERVVRLIMEGEEGKKMRRRTKELKESAHKALNNGGSSYNSLSTVVDFWKSMPN